MSDRSEPFRWDDPPGRRAQLRAELDAYYARLYGLTRDELRYTPLASTPKKSTAKTLRQAQDKFPWGDFPCAEGEGSQAVWGVSNVTASARGVGWAGERMKDEKRATMPQSKVEYNYFIVFTKDLMDFSVEER